MMGISLTSGDPFYWDPDILFPPPLPAFGNLLFSYIRIKTTLETFNILDVFLQNVKFCFEWSRNFFLKFSNAVTEL